MGLSMKGWTYCYHGSYFSSQNSLEAVWSINPIHPIQEQFCQRKINFKRSCIRNSNQIRIKMMRKKTFQRTKIDFITAVSFIFLLLSSLCWILSGKAILRRVRLPSFANPQKINLESTMNSILWHKTPWFFFHFSWKNSSLALGFNQVLNTTLEIERDRQYGRQCSSFLIK